MQCYVLIFEQQHHNNITWSMQSEHAHAKSLLDLCMTGQRVKGKLCSHVVKHA